MPFHYLDDDKSDNDDWQDDEPNKHSNQAGPFFEGQIAGMEKYCNHFSMHFGFYCARAK